MPQTRRQFLKTATLGVGVAGVLGVPDVTGAQGQKLVVWWNKGYYPEEDAAMQKIVKEFEASHKVEIDLSFTAQGSRRCVSTGAGRRRGCGPPARPAESRTPRR